MSRWKFEETKPPRNAVYFGNTVSSFFENSPVRRNLGLPEKILEKEDSIPLLSFSRAERPRRARGGFFERFSFSLSVLHSERQFPLEIPNT